MKSLRYEVNDIPRYNVYIQTMRQTNAGLRSQVDQNVGMFIWQRTSESLRATQAHHKTLDLIVYYADNL